MSNDANKAEKEFSQDKGNLEVISHDSSASSDNQAVSLDKDGLNVKRGGNVVIGSLNVVIEPFRNRHQKYYRHSKFHLWADVALLLFIAAALAFLVWSKVWQPARPVSLEIVSASEAATSGAVKEFELVYANDDGGPLDDATLALRLPDDFNLEKVEPESSFDKTNNTITLGALASGANGKVRVKGRVWGELGSHASFAAILSYERNGDDMTVMNSLPYTINDSVIKLSMDAIDEVYRGNGFVGEVRIENQGQEKTGKLELAFDEAWSVRSDDSKQADTFLFEGLAAGEKRIVDFKALPQDGNRLGAIDFKATAYMTVGDQKARQAEAVAKLAIREPALELVIEPDKSVARDGDSITYDVSYKNLEEYALDDLALTVQSGNRNYTFDGIEFFGTEDFKRQGGELSTGSLAAFKEGKFSIKARLKQQKKATNQEVALQVRVSYRVRGQQVRYAVSSGKVRLLSNLAVASTAYYYSPQGDQLGVGPLPPTVGIPTNYWIYWTVDNSGNDLKDVALTAKLPGNAIWLDNKSLLAGNMFYSQANRSVTWTIDQLEAESLNNKVRFEVGIIPTDKDIGKSLDLLTGVKFKALDKFCGKELAGQLEDVTTELKFDRLSRGKGKVVN